jgi:uncharacterized LabA/DUF88 family protein
MDARGLRDQSPVLFLPSKRKIIMDSTERVAIFIDGSNFYHGLKANLDYSNIDFGKFCNQLLGSRRLTRIYYYNAPKNAKENPTGYKQQQSFYNQIKKVPFLELKLGRLVIRNNIPIEKGVDVLITVDLIKYARNNAYDTAILVSGDGDFAPALEFLKEFGKHIENAYFSKGRSYHLSNHSDCFINLDQFPWEELKL